MPYARTLYLEIKRIRRPFNAAAKAVLGRAATSGNAAGGAARGMARVAARNHVGGDGGMAAIVAAPGVMTE